MLARTVYGRKLRLQQHAYTHGITTKQHTRYNHVAYSYQNTDTAQMVPCCVARLALHAWFQLAGAGLGSPWSRGRVSDSVLPVQLYSAQHLKTFGQFDGRFSTHLFRLVGTLTACGLAVFVTIFGWFEQDRQQLVFIDSVRNCGVCRRWSPDQQSMTYDKTPRCFAVHALSIACQPNCLLPPLVHVLPIPYRGNVTI